MPLGAVPAPRRWLAEGRASRRLALAVVFVALLLDNMLLTVVGRAAGHLGGDPACRDGCGCAGRGQPRGGMGEGAARASSLSQHPVQLAQNQLKSLTTFFFFSQYRSSPPSFTQQSTKVLTALLPHASLSWLLQPWRLLLSPPCSPILTTAP